MYFLEIHMFLLKKLFCEIFVFYEDFEHLEDCGQPTKQGKTKCVAFTHSRKIIQFSVPVSVPVPVPVYFSFWFRFRFKIFKFDFGSVPADISISVDS